MNTSLFRSPQCSTKSALDKNLKAKANSKKPKITLVVFNHPPDLGKEFNQLGNSANKANGNAKAKPKPAIPIVSCIAVSPAEFIEPANKEPKIGPVQEKETMAKVNAIKKIPKIPPTLEAESILFPHELGSVISKYPKNEKAKKTKIAKKKTFNHALVEMVFSMFGSSPSIK